jgi:hypothetical protein
MMALSLWFRKRIRFGSPAEKSRHPAFVPNGFPSRRVIIPLMFARQRQQHGIVLCPPWRDAKILHNLLAQARAVTK